MRHPKGGVLVAAGLGAMALFGLLFISLGIHGPVRLMSGALGTGLVLTVYGFVRWWREPGGGDPRLGRRRKVRILVVGLLGMAVSAALVTTYALSAIESAEFYCHRVSFAPTMGEREEAWIEAQPRWKRARVFDRIHACDSAASDMEGYSTGRCPFIPANDGPCDCAGHRWPDDWKSDAPAKCVGGKGLMVDDWPEGRRDRWFLPWDP